MNKSAREGQLQLDHGLTDLVFKELGNKLKLVIQNDLQYLRIAELTKESQIRDCMARFIKSVSSYNIDLTELIKKAFENKYFINEPMTWQYASGGQLYFLAAAFKQKGVKNGFTLSLNDDNTIKVCNRHNNYGCKN